MRAKDTSYEESVEKGPVTIVVILRMDCVERVEVVCEGLTMMEDAPELAVLWCLLFVAPGLVWSTPCELGYTRDSLVATE